MENKKVMRETEVNRVATMVAVFNQKRLNQRRNQRRPSLAGGRLGGQVSAEKLSPTRSFRLQVCADPSPPTPTYPCACKNSITVPFMDKDLYHDSIEML